MNLEEKIEKKKAGKYKVETECVQLLTGNHMTLYGVYCMEKTSLLFKSPCYYKALSLSGDVQRASDNIKGA